MPEADKRGIETANRSSAVTIISEAIPAGEKKTPYMMNFNLF